ncbi:MAG: nucleotidyl transferase AbiEii/AbiGii toxin family protein, partial [Bacteroidota bacterium]|nr:nucleotidyl transferase AbiEii/AbiGii toxin family protein [Bacteroidota bacterium]
KNFFPEAVCDHAVFYKYMLKEYIQLMILDYLSSTSYVEKVVFIGGTNLRLEKGIDRFSEDLEFDCKNFSRDEFSRMTDDILLFLNRSGYRAEARDKSNPKITAFRRNIHFPGLLFEMGLSDHKEERFLIKVECQDQGTPYEPRIVDINRCGFFFPFPVPSDGVLCGMKVSAMLSRSKGRDFYDLMFFLAQAETDYDFLAARSRIGNWADLKMAISERLKSVDLKVKQRDFEHLLFNKANSSKILRFINQSII